MNAAVITYRDLLKLLVVAAAFAGLMLWSDLARPIPAVGRLDSLRANLEALRADLDESRSAFNALASRFSTVEERCILRPRRPSIR